MRCCDDGTVYSTQRWMTGFYVRQAMLKAGVGSHLSEHDAAVLPEQQVEASEALKVQVCIHPAIAASEMWWW